MTLFSKLAVFALSISFFPAVHAEDENKPLWEIGAGVAAINLPIYRCANERRSFILPVPYLVYRGETLQVDRDRLRGLIFRNDSLEMDISINGSVPAKSNNSVERSGMPDLLPTLEIGPSLNKHLYYSEDKQVNFDMRFPLRAVIASNLSHSQGAGLLFQPQLNFDVHDIQHSGWNLGLVGSIIFSDRTYQRYFYDVLPQYATTIRPAYTSTGGYSGTQFIGALSRRYENHWVACFVKLDDLTGATFVNSQLVNSRQSATVGFAVSWILDKSDKLVKVNNN